MKLSMSHYNDTIFTIHIVGMLICMVAATLLVEVQDSSWKSVAKLLFTAAVGAMSWTSFCLVMWP